MRALGVTIFALVAVALATPAAAASFRITSSAEDRDAKPGDGVCATASGACTVRAALEEADALGKPSDIVRPALANPSRLVAVRTATPRPHPRAPVTTFTVDTTVDAPDATPGDGLCATAEGACSLRAAIMEANDLADPQAITLPAGHYAITAADPDEDEAKVGDLDVLDELTITGAGADMTTIDGEDAGTVLDAYHDLTVTGVTITGGAPFGLAAWFASVTVTDCEILENATGINQRNFALTLTRGKVADNDRTAYLFGCQIDIDGTTFEDNGSGIEFDLGNRGTIANAVFQRNGAVGFFGVANQITFDTVEIRENGMGFGVGFTDLASYVTVENSLIEDNTGEAVFLQSGSVEMSNTIVRDNGGCAVTSGSHDGGSLALTNVIVERNGCGVEVGLTARRYDARIVDSEIIDNRGVGVSAYGSPSDPAGTSVTILRSTIARNGGGGLYGEGVNGSGPFFTVIDSTISGNEAERGGGILITGDGRTRPSFTLVNSTVSGNSAPTGDGILNEAGDLDLRNVTLAGDGLYIDTDGTALMRNTILAGGCHGTFASAGYNLIAPNTGCTITGDTTGNQTATALLDPLADNGGPTETHALAPGSPARDGGNPAGCVDADDEPLLADQRGVARPQGPHCDVGAFEATCGNDSIDDGETCDDGNTADGDCCNARCQVANNGASCSDGNACTLDDTCQAGVCTAGADQQCGPCLSCLPEGGCVAEPWTGCHQPTERLSGELEIVAKPNRRLIEWSWVEGEATSREQLGNPLADDRYSFCVYESAATPRIVFAATTRTDPCGKKSCWKPTGKTGFQYSAPSSDLLRKVVLKSGAQGKAKVLVTAKGDQLVLPTLPMTLPLRAQMQAENGQCWESEFVADGVSKNDAKHFRAKASRP